MSSDVNFPILVQSSLLIFFSFCVCFWYHILESEQMKGKVSQECPTLHNLMDIVHGIIQARNIGVGSHSLLQGIFPIQGSNPGLRHCRWIFYKLPPAKSKVTKIYTYVVVFFLRVLALLSKTLIHLKLMFVYNMK